MDMQDTVEEHFQERTVPMWTEAHTAWQDTLQKTSLQGGLLRNVKSNCLMQAVFWADFSWVDTF